MDCQKQLQGKWEGGLKVKRDELVEKMGFAYVEGVAGSMPCELTDPVRRGMAAALSVAVEEMLKSEPERECRNDWDELYETEISAYKAAKDFPQDAGFRAALKLIASRRSRYLKPKSTEERVTIELMDDWHRVSLDGKVRFSHLMREHAEIYRIGLIQQLKEQPK